MLQLPSERIWPLNSCSVILQRPGATTRWQRQPLKQATIRARPRCQQPRNTPRKPPPQLSVALWPRASAAERVAPWRRQVAS